MQLLLDAAPITESPDGSGLRPLEIAIASNNTEAVQRFLRKGAKLSPATWAAAKDRPEILLLLFNKLLDDGHVLYKKGRLDDAAHRFQYALKKLNTDCAGDYAGSNSKLDIVRVKYHLLLNLARCKRKSGDRESAVKLCTEAAQLEPEETEAYYSRARCFYEADKFDSARLDLLRILKMKPSSKEAADLLSKIGDRLKCRPLSTFKTTATNNEGLEIRRVSSPKSWEQGSSDSGNIADIEPVKVCKQVSRSPQCTNVISGRLEENSFESEL